MRLVTKKKRRVMHAESLGAVLAELFWRNWCRAEFMPNVSYTDRSPRLGRLGCWIPGLWVSVDWQACNGSRANSVRDQDQCNVIKGRTAVFP